MFEVLNVKQFKKKEKSISFVLFSLKIKIKTFPLASFSVDSGSSESPASLKRVASPAGKPAASGEGENRTQVTVFKRAAEVTWYKQRMFELRLGVTLKHIDWRSGQ